MTKIVFMGTPEFGVPMLEELNKKYDVVLVVTQPDSYKKNKPIYSPVKIKALELGLPVFQPKAIKDDYQMLLDAKADYLITAAYGQFIPTKLLKLFKNSVNVHGSLLPKRRGGAPIQRSVIEGDSETGVTLIQMVKKMDAGVMYAKVAVPILDEDNNSTMFDKLSIAGTKLLMDNIEDIFNGKLKGEEQDEAEATISYNLSKEDEHINFAKTSREVFNQIRGLANEPGGYFMAGNEIFKVYASKILTEAYSGTPGEILQVKKRLIIKTLDGAVEITLIKPASKNIMKTQDFLNGNKVLVQNMIVE